MSKNITTYGQQASTLAASYNTLATPDILPDFAAHIQALPDKAATCVLDIGCGSGRDAFWTAQHGVAVVAADGAADMLSEARKQNNHSLINYIEDQAPALHNIRNLGIKFDVVLMSAFLFHFDAAERQEFYNNLKPLLREKCSLFITLRHGPVPAGRIMHHVPLQELDDFAKAHNGSSHFHGNKPDPLNRSGVSWDHLSLNLK